MKADLMQTYLLQNHINNVLRNTVCFCGKKQVIIPRFSGHFLCLVSSIFLFCFVLFLRKKSGANLRKFCGFLLHKTNAILPYVLQN